MKSTYTLLILAFSCLFSVNISAQSLNTRFIPDMELHDINDKVVKTSVLNNGNKPFIVVFWAVWNKTCLLELNTIMERYDGWTKEYGVKLFAISVDEKQRMQRAKGYAEAKDWHYDVYFDEHGTMENAMKILGVPHIILFNANRERVWEMHEYHSGDELELEKQLELLKNKKSEPTTNDTTEESQP